MAQENNKLVKMHGITMGKTSALAWFLPRAVILWNACFAIVALVIILGRLAYPNAACLNVEGLETDTLDPQTGRVLTNFQPDQSTVASNQPLPLGYSSTGKRLAYFAGYNRSGLRVETLKNPVLTNERLYANNTIESFVADVQWSPDDQWIAYRWKDTDGKQYLAIADPNGHERNITTLDSLPNEQIQLQNWSADSKYIAVLNLGGGRGTAGRIRFLSVPDLKMFDPGDLSKTLDSGCILQNDGRQSMDCQPWAAQGHRAAYVIDKDATTSNLVMLNLDNHSEKVFPLPTGEQSRTVRISPNGQSVAIGSFLLSNNTSAEGEMSVYTSDGSVISNISNVTFACVGCAEGGIFAEITWSPDSKSIAYTRSNPNDPSLTKIMLFRPETGENRVLLDNLTDSYGVPNFSSDGQYASVSSDGGGYRKIYLIKIGDGTSHLVSSDTVVAEKWSPDGKLLAFADEEDPNTANSTVKLVDRDGNEVSRFTAKLIDTLVWTPCR